QPSGPTSPRAALLPCSTRRAPCARRLHLAGRAWQAPVERLISLLSRTGAPAGLSLPIPHPRPPPLCSSLLTHPSRRRPLLHLRRSPAVETPPPASCTPSRTL